MALLLHFDRFVMAWRRASVIYVLFSICNMKVLVICGLFRTISNLECVKLCVSHVFVPYVHACLTCLRVLRGHFPYVSACLRDFASYVPSFFMSLTYFHFFTCLVYIHFLRACVILFFHVRYVPPFCTCLTFLHFFKCFQFLTCLKCLHLSL